MRKLSSLQSTAEKLGITYMDILLRRGPGKNWICPLSGQFLGVEEAVLAHFKTDGWRGYSGEGGLLLNLIKAMSFKSVAPRNRATYIEALYAHNVAFAEDRFPVEEMLAQVAISDRHVIERNFELMASREVLAVQYEGFSSTSSTSMLDFFPGLERWMFVELLEVAGNALLHSIASKFSQSPYEYRRGWPDITMWKNGELRFIEVKSPGDRLYESQRVIVNEFAKPLGLNFSLAGVQCLNLTVR
jgi:hypothetical protein